MSITRRAFGKLARATVPAALIGDRSLASAQAAQRPNSLINGVQVGVITYSYRAMPAQGADAVLRYVLESGVSAVELMGGPIEASSIVSTVSGGWSSERDGGTPSRAADGEPRAATSTAGSHRAPRVECGDRIVSSRTTSAGRRSIASGWQNSRATGAWRLDSGLARAFDLARERRCTHPAGLRSGSAGTPSTTR